MWSVARIWHEIVQCSELPPQIVGAKCCASDSNVADHITRSGFACWTLAAQQCASEYVNHLNAGGYFAMALKLRLQLIWD